MATLRGNPFIPRSQLRGIDATLRAIGKARSAMAPAIKEGLEKAAHTILKKADQYVPIDTDSLRKSGRVEVMPGSGLAAKAAVVYGSPSPGSAQDPFYAVYVHERLDQDINRPGQGRPRGSKYLERAVREVRGSIASTVKREVEIAMKVV